MTPLQASSLQASWGRAWRALGLPAPDALFDRLVASWDEPQRKYHTVQHLLECIERLAPMLGQAQQAGEVELALWFHDAIYDVQGHDNEARSANWAAQALTEAGAATDVVERVRALIMATCHAALPTTPDAQLLVDIDLSILGATPERFDEYERQVRDEYAWVPEPLFRDKRKAVLEGRARCRAPALPHFMYFIATFWMS